MEIGCTRGICSANELCPAGLTCYREAVVDGHADAAKVPQCLLDLGLMEPLTDEPGQFAPVPAAVAATRALQPHEQEIAAKKSVIESLLTTFGAAEDVYTAGARERLPGTQLLRGTEAISRTIDTSVGCCVSELMTAQPGGGRPPEILESAIERSLETIRRGVRQRTLYQHAVRADPATIRYVAQITEAGAEVRTVDEMFDRLIICDLSVAYIPTSSSYEAEALEIRHPAIVRFLANVFNHAWGRGIEMAPSTTRRPKDVATDLERALARMLVAGGTEERIARDLGMSRRTIAEHTSRLSRRLGSTSRAQLGYFIATSGLLQEEG